MKPCSLGIAILPLLFFSQPSVARSRDTPQMAELGQQAGQTAAAARKKRAVQDDYIAALQAYNHHQWEVPHGEESSLYRQYKTLLAKYTKDIVYYQTASSGRNHPQLSLVNFPAGAVSIDEIKADYVTMAQDYLTVLKGRSGEELSTLPPELPPLPPIPFSDEDASKLLRLESTLRGALSAALAGKSLRGQALGPFGPNVPLGGLHTHPGQSGQESGGWCQVDSGGGLVPCN